MTHNLSCEVSKSKRCKCSCNRTRHGIRQNTKNKESKSIIFCYCFLAVVLTFIIVSVYYHNEIEFYKNAELYKNADCTTITFVMHNHSSESNEPQLICSWYMNSTNVTTYNKSVDNNTIIRSECCYPAECSEAVNNPENCDCVYAVKCGVD